MTIDSSHRHLATTIQDEIRSLPRGARVPTHRELVQRFNVSATTVADALSVLRHQGLIESRPGAGTFRAGVATIDRAGDTSWQEAALEQSERSRTARQGRRRFDASAMLATLAPPSADVVDLSGGYLHPTLQPQRLLTSALARAARRTEAWERPASGGLPELRDWFAADIGGGLSRHDVLICNGGQGALATSLRALTNPGDPVIVESPSYPGTSAAALAAGLDPVTVPLDQNGMRADELGDAIARTNARVIVVQSNFHNPTGVNLSESRGEEILRIARQHKAFVIEDDCARLLAHADSGPRSPSLISRDPDGAVINIRSLTKVTSPNLRVGAIAARGPVMSRLRSASVIDTMMVPAPLQYTMLEVVTSSGWRRELADLSTKLQLRRDIVIDAVSATFPAGALKNRPTGGFHVWVALPSNTDSRRFAAAALARGISVTPGDNYVTNDDGTSHIRISYIAAPAIADIAHAIRRLDGVVTEFAAAESL